MPARHRRLVDYLREPESFRARRHEHVLRRDDWLERQAYEFNDERLPHVLSLLDCVLCARYSRTDTDLREAALAFEGLLNDRVLPYLELPALRDGHWRFNGRSWKITKPLDEESEQSRQATILELAAQRGGINGSLPLPYYNLTEKAARAAIEGRLKLDGLEDRPDHPQR
jgi:hypothetical protein